MRTCAPCIHLMSLPDALSQHVDLVPAQQAPSQCIALNTHARSTHAQWLCSAGRHPYECRSHAPLSRTCSAAIPEGQKQPDNRSYLIPLHMCQHLESRTQQLTSIKAPVSQVQGVSSRGIGGGSPVVLMYPGFSGGKEEYSAVATILAEAGYFVVVLQQLVAPAAPIPAEFDVPSGPSNIVRPTATALALDWLNKGSGEQQLRGYRRHRGAPVVPACPAPDTRNVLLVAHSYGATAVRPGAENCAESRPPCTSGVERSCFEGAGAVPSPRQMERLHHVLKRPGGLMPTYLCMPTCRSRVNSC